MRLNLNTGGGGGPITQVDVDRLPLDYEEKADRKTGIFLTLFSLAWGGIPTVALIFIILSGQFEPGALAILIFTVIGAGLFVLGLTMLFKKKRIRIDSEGVSVDEKGLFGAKSWSEPLSRYKGVASREEYHSGGKNSPSYTLYIVELAHDEKDKVITLYSSKAQDGHRRIWEDYCRKLNLNAVEKDGDGFIERAVEDLDKTVAELVREGKIDVSFDPSQNVPQELVVHPEGDELVITITKKKSAVGCVISALVAMGIPGAFIYLGFLSKKAPPMFGVVGVFFVLVMIVVAVFGIMMKERIRVSRNMVSTCWTGRWGDLFTRSINGSELESVKVYRKDGTAQEAVWLVSDMNTLAVGRGLKREALEWLRNCILKVITS